MQMTSREEIERLLNQVGCTLNDLPEHHNDAEIHNRIKELIGTWGLYAGMPELGEHILHQSDVIEVLVEALKVALTKTSRWISIKDRQPERGSDVLVYVPRYHPHNNRRHARYSINGRWQNVRGELVTHWMPLPEPPKENNDEQ